MATRSRSDPSRSAHSDPWWCPCLRVVLYWQVRSRVSQPAGPCPFRPEATHGSRARTTGCGLQSWELNGRGMAHVSAFAAASNMQVTHLVDVDSQVLRTRGGEVAQKYGPTKLEHDYRRVLDSRSVDILSVATPDHWHAKAALDAMSAGKHVYLEKPCGIAPSEGEALIAAQKRSGLVLQVGNQQRSSVETRRAGVARARWPAGRDLRG